MQDNTSHRLLCIVLALFVSGCPSGRITIPSADSTVPELVFIITRERPASTSTQVVNISSGSSQPSPITAQPNDAYILSATGKDPEGVKETQIWVNYTYWKTNSNGTATQIGPGLLANPTARSADASSPGGTGYKERPVLHTIKIEEDIRKQAGATRMRLQISAVALNYHGGRAQTPEVILNWP